jgi:hypothetical protein
MKWSSGEARNTGDVYMVICNGIMVMCVVMRAMQGDIMYY